MSTSEIYAFLEVSTLCAYAKLAEDVQKLEAQGITNFEDLANVTEEDLDRWSIMPTVKHVLTEGNKIKKLPSPPQETQTKPALQETIDTIIPQVEAMVQQMLSKFQKDVEELIDRKVSEFEEGYVLDFKIRPRKDNDSTIVGGNDDEGVVEPRD